MFVLVCKLSTDTFWHWIYDIVLCLGFYFSKDNNFSEKQVELFRLTPLKNLHRQLSDGLLDGHLKFAKDLYDDIAELLRVKTHMLVIDYYTQLAITIY